MSAGRSIEGSSFVLLCHGDDVSPPAGPMRDYLLKEGAARVTFVVHPLSPEEGSVHTVDEHDASGRVRRRARRLPTKVPYTYPLDVLWPGSLPACDVWVGFNNLLAARGLLARRRGRAGKVVYWAVDFVPDRFGAASPMTAAYDRLDAYVARAVDLRLEISRHSLEARSARLGLGADAAPAEIAGIGAWVQRAAKTPPDGHRARRIVFIGHLVERMGVTMALDALERLGPEAGVHLDIAGRGPLEASLKARVAAAGLQDRVTFHGYIGDHEQLERLLARASVGLAPYVPEPDSFTRWADPSKLKAYLAAGLPILLTDVPPNARELAEHGGAEVVDYEPGAWADAVTRTLVGESWPARRDAALTYAQRFDWSTVLAPAMRALGYAPSVDR